MIHPASETPIRKHLGAFTVGGLYKRSIIKKS